MKICVQGPIQRLYTQTKTVPNAHSLDGFNQTFDLTKGVFKLLCWDSVASYYVLKASVCVIIHYNEMHKVYIQYFAELQNNTF